MESLGGKPVAFDYAPFAETAELLYGGPWVAERYHAARSLVEGDPNALLPVIRGILNGARNYDAVDVQEVIVTRLKPLEIRAAVIGIGGHGNHESSEVVVDRCYLEIVRNGL